MTAFVPGQLLTGAALNAAFAQYLPIGGVSTFTQTLLSQTALSGWATILGLPASGNTALLNAANVFTAIGGVSSSVIKLNGIIFAGGTSTTTKPLVLIEPAGTPSTGWSNGGTAFGINTGLGSGGYAFDIQAAGSTVFNVRGDGFAQSVTAMNLQNGIIRFGYSGSGLVDVAADAGRYTLGAAVDTALTRKAAANWQLGFVDAAAPVAQTLSTQSVLAGTSNTPGVNFTFQASGGTGTGVGGSFVWQVAASGSTGTARNAWATGMTLDSNSNLNVVGSITSPALSGVIAPSTTATTQTFGDNSTKIATTAFVIANATASVVTNTRSTVLSGPQTAGAPTLFPATSVSLTLTSQNVSAGSPMIVSAANGFSGTGGNVDVVGQSTANLTWTAITAVTNYHGVTIAGNILTPFTTTLQWISQYGGTISVVNGQYTYDTSQEKMFLGNGTVANQVNAVFVGESVAGASTITATAVYAYRGYYDSGYINTLPGLSTQTSKNSNIGVVEHKIRVLLKCLTAEGGFSVGDIYEMAVTVASNPNYGPLPINPGRLTSSFTTSNAVAFGLYNKTTGVYFVATAANWAYKIIASRTQVGM